MKISTWVWVLALAIPINASGQSTKTYLAISPGVYHFTGNLGEDHPLGFYSDFIFGYSIIPQLTIESGIAYLHDGVGYFQDGLSYGTDIRAYLLHIGAKKTIPVNGLDLFVGAGIGVGHMDHRYVIDGGYVDNSEGIAFAHLSFGADFEITQKFFMGFEGKYLSAEKVDYDPGLSIDLDGFAHMLRLGFRY